ncbi:MAG: tyrosine-protein phosphatase [Oscillospiraceae bacterium]|jgi:protein-tyrosine phosphatase
MYYRRYPISCARNVRDLGGYPTQNGGVTKFGVFIRSNMWDDAPDQDIALIKSAGVTTVIDLRSSDEVERHPHPLNESRGFDYHNVPLNGGGRIPASKKEIPDTYVDMIDGPEYIAEAFRILADAQGAVLFNCVAGKDRTGLVAEFLLEIAGVGKDDVMADYVLSDPYLREGLVSFAKSEGMDPDRIIPVRDTWEEFYRRFSLRYKDVRTYLLEAGVTEEELGRIVDKFVDR